MKRGFFKITFLLGIAWVAYANIHLVDQLVKRFQDADQGVKTKMEMFQAAKCVQMYFVDSNRLPTATEFPVMIRECTKDEGRKQLKDAAQDIWGTFFRLVPEKAGFYVASAGPDKEWGSKDDLTFYQTMGNLGQAETGAATGTAAATAGSTNAATAPSNAQPRQGAVPARQAPAKPKTPMEYTPRQFTPREFTPKEYKPQQFTPKEYKPR